jgi:hypothetical protein
VVAVVASLDDEVIYYGLTVKNLHGLIQRENSVVDGDDENEYDGHEGHLPELLQDHDAQEEDMGQDGRKLDS